MIDSLDIDAENDSRRMFYESHFVANGGSAKI